jgi:molybdopterin-guanine dinucleotide biosynthesis protein A
MAGLVLAGGRSTRFGGDKAVAMLGGRTFLAWCAGALGDAGAAVAVNARPGGTAAAQAQALGLEVLFDDPGLPAGPLNGVLAGLDWAAARGFEALLTLPCDTPRVGAAHLRALSAAFAGHDAAYAVAAGRPQGLCAAWRTTLAGPLRLRLAGGEHPSIHALMAALGAAPVMFEDAAAFANINTRADLAAMAGRAPPARD